MSVRFGKSPTRQRTNHPQRTVSPLSIQRTPTTPVGAPPLGIEFHPRSAG